MRKCDNNRVKLPDGQSPPGVRVPVEESPVSTGQRAG